MEKSRNMNNDNMVALNNQKPIDKLSSLPSFMLNWIEENSNEIVTVWDNTGKIFFISNSVERLLGYHPSELKGVYWHEFVCQEDVRYISENYNKHKQEAQFFTIHIRNNEGKLIWCECNIARLTDVLTNESYYISTIKDISEKKEVEEMMVRSEKMSIAGQLAAGVAHEIRNPLTSLKGFLQLLQAGVNRKDVYYKIMIDEIKKIETITSELLFISKPLTDDKQWESVEEMIDDVIELLKSQARLENVIIKKDLEQDCTIYCDRSQIKQVLINLVKNAIEATETTGTVTIKVKIDNLLLEIEVIDEGIGIDEEIIHKLGEPFFTTKQKGTGLGLMITKQILERHNATMEINQNKQKGSTFRLIFPYNLKT